MDGVYLYILVYGSVDWIQLAQQRVQRTALLNTQVNRSYRGTSRLCHQLLLQTAS